MIGDNPAARLLAILEDGRHIQTNMTSRKAWHQLLNVPEGDAPLLMSRLGKVMELPQQIIRIIDDEFPNQGGSYSHWSNRVNSGFEQQNINGNWNTFWQHIDSHTLNYLKLSADLIQTKTPTTLLNEETVEEIREKIDQLLNELLEGGFETEFKQFLSRALQRIIIVVDEYRISGAVPIIESVEIVFGHAFFDEKYRKEVSTTEFGKKLITVLSSVASSVTIALGIPQLPESFQIMLEKIGVDT